VDNPEDHKITVYLVDEVASILRCKVRKVRNLIRSGSLHATRIGNTYLIKPEAIQALLELDVASTGAPDRAARVRLMNDKKSKRAKRDSDLAKNSAD
jgi:excisionase family DNA binding protein